MKRPTVRERRETPLAAGRAVSDVLADDSLFNRYQMLSGTTRTDWRVQGVACHPVEFLPGASTPLAERSIPWVAPMNFGSPDLDGGASARSSRARLFESSPRRFFEPIRHAIRCRRPRGFLVSQAAPLENAPRPPPPMRFVRTALVFRPDNHAANDPRASRTWLGPAANFANLFGSENGNWKRLFRGATVQGPAPSRTPWVPIRHGLSYVGTAGQGWQTAASPPGRASLGRGTCPRPRGRVARSAQLAPDALRFGNAFQEPRRRIPRCVNVGAGPTRSTDGDDRLARGHTLGRRRSCSRGVPRTTGANVWGGVRVFARHRSRWFSSRTGRRPRLIRSTATRSRWTSSPHCSARTSRCAP